MKESEYKKTVNIQAVDRALSVIETIYQNGREMGVNEIAQQLGEYQSTIYRVIVTLINRGYLYQNNGNDKYGLNYKLYLIGRQVEKNSSLIRIAKPYAKMLSEEFQENVNVAIRNLTPEDAYTATTIYQENGSRRSLGITESIGKPYECFYSGVGKALLAFAEDFSAEKILTVELHKYTEKSIVDNQAMIEELEKIRRQGYAIDDEENEQGLICVACPVLNAKGHAVMAISVSGLKQNIERLGVERIARRIREACSAMGSEVM